MSDTLILVLTTEASPRHAEALARTLLEERLVACVSLFPVCSLYRWEGRLERSDEVQLLLKTAPSQLEALRQAVLERHSYALPEWIEWPATAGGSYGTWCLEQLQPR
ncbi:MAG: divalent-cation tolerance protein CutA [Synechococcaceae cyanobacterium]|nr:divalent-cation tolerance protein CutA [Synechococcaceae cyanobacterium]